MGVCEPWATLADLTGPCEVPDEGEPAIAEAELTAALQVASDIMYVLSGRQFSGACTDVLHPCPDTRHAYPTEPSSWSNTSVTGQPGAYATGYGARWLATCHHRRSQRCGCTRLHALDLGVAPIRSVTKVVVAGVELAAADYRVDDERELIRLDGEPWPSCVDHNDEDAFRVELTHGLAPPQAGVWAAAALACQLALSRDPDQAGECKLPKRVTSVTRQGLSMVVLDPMDFLDDGKTGVYEVDLFLKAYNPGKLQRRATVMSPDIGRRARRIGT